MAAAHAAYAQTPSAQAAAATEVESVQVTARNLEDTLPEQLAQTGMKVEVVSGSPVWAFASIIDKKTLDPEYLAASPAN